ncbi:hypothetical protein [Nocardiopsis tropica]|uniref:Helix-turn-helix domain-containing protein n=1 Tax=Nocardiopsis tropica TaxID=109330 RepID=A0ABU7KR49_9ACTN|nr:hypothetical protein [Nocardiopsis umidischolae]MEE2051776.1 hypothetical protein [Nocardiopsis umidischolae]
MTMVEDGGRPGITVAEIAEKYGRSRSLVSNTWTARAEWKEHVRVVGTRGRALEYDPEDVDALVREWMWLPPKHPGIPASRRLTMQEIAEYSGLTYGRIRSEATRGRLAGHDQADTAGTRTWKREQVDTLLTGFKFRDRDRDRG